MRLCALYDTGFDMNLGKISAKFPDGRMGDQDPYRVNPRTKEISVHNRADERTTSPKQFE